MERDAKTYINDGIYADDLGHQIKLHTPRSNGDHIIYFESPGLWIFLRWLRLRGRLPDAALDELKAYTPDGPEEMEEDLAGLKCDPDNQMSPEEFEAKKNQINPKDAP